MIVLSHYKGVQFLKAERNGHTLNIAATTICEVFWNLAEAFPEDLIVWKDDTLNLRENIDIFSEFTHKFVMISFPVESQFIPDEIGYVDQLPFVKPNYAVRYPSWRMSIDIGGMYSKAVLRFREIFSKINDFGYLISSIAKLGQQNGLMCYLDQKIIKSPVQQKLKLPTSYKFLIKFVGQHYKKQRLVVLLLCLWKYHKKLPVFSILKAFASSSYFQKSVDIDLRTGYELSRNVEIEDDIDLVIPTLFRKKYVLQLLEDLRTQTKLPKRVIIVEQNPEAVAKSEFDFATQNWPFEIIHRFVHEVGACNARNLAMRSVISNYVFFADDDIRLYDNFLLEKSLKEMKRLGSSGLNLNCLQPGEKTIFSKIKQWGAFGSGTSIVLTNFAKRCRFSEFLEKGFGEDIDYGLQLRNLGCDVIYHPDLQFVHLKADRGGFRELSGIGDDIPKPSPTMMYLVQNSYSKYMLKGYKITLFLKFYTKQPIRNPWSYYVSMKKRWEMSESLCNELSSN